MSYIPQAYIKGKPKFLTALNLLLGIARSSFWGRWAGSNVNFGKSRLQSDAVMQQRKEDEPLQCELN